MIKIIIDIIIISITAIIGFISGYVEFVKNEEGDRKIKDILLADKTGEWIVDKTDEGDIHIIDYRCSCCNRYNILHGDFCKWCGAKMVEKQERSEE